MIERNILEGNTTDNDAENETKDFASFWLLLVKNNAEVNRFRKKTVILFVKLVFLLV
jgi:hypothetical protein